MKRFLLAVWCAIAASCSMAPVPALAAERPDILEVIAIDGEIHEGMAASIQKQVESINDNKRVKAVLLIVDSPGGGVLPSAVIYEELSKLKVPVVGWCQNICASGGMYALMAPSVKFIGVRTSTISGSIGVIMRITRYNRLLDWAKIDSETYKSGSSKDSGNPTRSILPGEAEELQGTVTELASTFYSIVGKARPKLTAAQWAEIKSAKIFFGQKGVDVGLVDAVMNRDAIEKKAKSLSGSSLIFTRDELKKMSKDNEDRSPYMNAPAPITPMAAWLDHATWLINTAKEIKSGSSIVLEYRYPVKL